MHSRNNAIWNEYANEAELKAEYSDYAGCASLQSEKNQPFV